METRTIAGIIVVIVIVVAASYFLFLRGGPFDSPQATIHTMADAVNDRDANLLYRCLSENLQGQTTVDELETVMETYDNMELKITIDEISDVEIADDSATASVTITATFIDPITGKENKNTDTNEVSFVREDDKWKLPKLARPK